MKQFVLLLSNCKKLCEIKYPKDIKSVSWENYNDVPTVYWNYYTDCSEVKREDLNKELMVFGWVYPDKPSADLFYLMTDGNSASRNGNPHVFINTQRMYAENDSLQQQVQILLDSSDLTKKCFIKGELSLASLSDNDCCWILATIFIKSITDIYFE